MSSLPAHNLLHLGGQRGDERHVASKNKEHYHKCFIGENCFQRSDVVYPESNNKHLVSDGAQCNVRRESKLKQRTAEYMMINFCIGVLTFDVCSKH